VPKIPIKALDDRDNPVVFLARRPHDLDAAFLLPSVVTPEIRATRRTVFESMPITRAISRCALPASSRVWIEIRKFGFKTFNSGAFSRGKRA
jgi:hypothetical protein